MGVPCMVQHGLECRKGWSIALKVGKPASKVREIAFVSSSRVRAHPCRAVRLQRWVWLPPLMLWHMGRHRFEARDHNQAWGGVAT